jgi:hypothetical protein
MPKPMVVRIQASELALPAVMLASGRIARRSSPTPSTTMTTSTTGTASSTGAPASSRVIDRNEAIIRKSPWPKFNARVVRNVMSNPLPISV